MSLIIRFGLTAALAMSAATAQAATVSFVDRSSWLSAIGEAPDNFEDFESGYSDGQGMDNAVIGDMTIASSSAKIETGPGSINDSNPIGSYALEIADSAGTAITFTFANAITYFGLFYIDAGTPEIGGVTFGNTGASGNSALFAGLTFDLSDNVTSVSIASIDGDGLWGVDNIEWGATSAAVPLPAGLPMLLSGLGLLAIGSRRRKT